MTRSFRTLFALACCCLPLLAAAAESDPRDFDRRIAITIDDLPWARLDTIVPADLAARHAQLIASLKAADVPIVGFVNENKLAAGGQVQPARLRRGDVPYMLNKVDYYERQSRELLGYDVPQIWLMHANELNAGVFADLVAGVRRRGYRAITLDEAMRDPAYARPDGYTGRYGPSWLHRWAMAEHRPKAFYAGEPTVPGWVLALAKVDSE